MATVSTNTLFLQRLSTLSGTYPSATSGSFGYDEVTAAPGDTIVIPLRSGSASTSGGGQMNFGYTPSGNTGTGGILGGFSQFSSTNNPIFVTCTNVTSSGFISIWCAPSDGGSSVGFRARVYVTVVAPIDLNISIGTNPVLLNSSTTTYTNSLTGCGSSEIYYASYTAGASQGSTTTYSNLGSIVGRTYNLFSSRTLFGPSGSGTSISGPGNSTADTVYIWAVLAPSVSGTNITSSTTMTYTGSSYIVDQPDTFITLTPSTTTLTGSSTSNVTVNVTGDTSGTQYRLYTNNINRWVSSYNGGGSSTTDFTISYDEAVSGGAGTGFTELPGIGQTYTYFSQARIPTTNGGSGNWQNTGNSFNVTRSNLDTQPDSFNLGGPVTVVTGVTANSNTITIGGMDTGASASYSITNTSYSRVSKNGGTFSTSSGTVVNGDTLQVQVDASTTSGVTRSTTLSVGSPTTSDSFSVTSTTGGGGGGTSGGGGTGSYGLRVNDTDGSTFIMGSAERFSSVLALQSISLSSSDPPLPITASMSGVSTSNSTVMFLGTPPISSDLLSSIVTYTSSGITINIANSGLSVLNSTVLFVRW